MNESRVKKGLINASVSFIFYLLTLLLSFVSRKIFLDRLGAEFIGLSGTLQNILGLLNIAELGIGTSVSFHLYKPIREENLSEINRLLSLFGWFYRVIGSFILAAAIVVSLFFPLIFKNEVVDLPLIYFVFFSFLLSSLIGYFINYRQILLTADQRNYIVSAYLQTANIVKIVIQMICCVYFLNYYLWASIELAFSVFACIFLNYKINVTYPWLHSNPKDGGNLYKLYPSVIKSTKQIFIHRMKDFLLKQSDQILIFAFVSLKYVAYYGNYSMLVVRISALFNSVMLSAEAGIGNLVAEGNKKKIMGVFWELMAMRYFLSGIIAVVLFFVFPPFITLWLGSEFLFSKFITALICINMFILMTRTSVDAYNHAYGQYADVWSAWAEGITNLLVTVVVASQIGLAGILLGKIVSMFLFVVLWKPYYLFSDAFKLGVWQYWKKTLVYYLVLGVCFLILCMLDEIKPVSPEKSWANLCLYGLYIGSIFSIAYFVALYYFSAGMKDFTLRLINQILNKKK